MIKVRHLRTIFLWRWFNVALMATKGVRLSPSSVLNGSASAFKLFAGVKINARCKLQVSYPGRLRLGENVWLSSDVEMETASLIDIGEGSTIQRRVTINGTVTLGVGCILAPNVFISSGTHPFREFGELPIREQERLIIAKEGSLSSLDRKVDIGDDCWLGVNAVICPGVTVGKGSVIGANSVVTTDIPQYSIAVGAPAKVVGSRLATR